VIVLEILLAILLGIAVNEMCDVSPWLARHVSRHAARIRYRDNPERAALRRDEYQSICDQAPGKLCKLLVALSFMAAAVAHHISRNSGSRQRSTHSFQSLSTRLLTGLKSAVTALLVAALLIGVGFWLSMDVLKITVPAYSVIDDHCISAAQTAVLLVIVREIGWRPRILSAVAVLITVTIGSALVFSFPLDTYLDTYGLAQAVVIWLGFLTALRNSAGVELLVATAAALAFNGEVLTRIYFDHYVNFEFYGNEYLPYYSLSDVALNVNSGFGIGLSVGIAVIVGEKMFPRLTTAYKEQV
jgi:hypothetical protein